ncbi:MAG TPA: heat-inducible transcriptional repressor HrcA [Gammaproteobacteria bacterium]|nr:heat-inducible transcriptional repressor HrcA [Gammaproteobacteria bacterium]
MAKEINERARHLLKALIESYIRDGQPVGSKKLARESGLDLSPATVRNVMADLEALGLVTSPHTSAGRVPTVRGYRLFVDSLLTVQPLETEEVQRLKRCFQREESMQDLAASVSGLLAELSRMAGVVMLPPREHLSLRRIEFLPLSAGRVLAILVINDQEVENTILHLPKSLSPAELQQAANYLNSLFAGKNLAEVRYQLLTELREARSQMDRLMRQAIGLAEQIFERDGLEEEEALVLAGQTRLMEFEELSDVEKLRELFEAFNEKRQVLHLLDQCLRSQQVQIFIGEESGYGVLNDCSVVSAPYQVDGEVLGVLGVIGPTRMDYEKVIPLVDVTARLVSAALKQRQ